MRIWRFAIIALVLAGTAAADTFYPVNVSFSSVTTTTDITVGGSPVGNTCITPSGVIAANCITLSGVTFQYDAQGQGGTGSVDSSGIFGDTSGALNLYFDFPAVGLAITYDVPGSLCSSACLLGVDNNSSSFSDATQPDTALYGSRAGAPVFPPATSA